MQWLDLTAHGARLQVAKLPSGAKLLVLARMPGAPGVDREAAGRLGFRFLPKSGVYVRDNTRFGANEFRAEFPRLRIVDLPPDQILRPVGAPRPGAEGEAAAGAAPAAPAVHVALAQAERLGINYLGQEVFRGADGRFIRDAEGKQVREGELASAAPAVFLRAPDAESMALCADALVAEAAAGRTQRRGDLLHFAAAVLDEERVADNDPRLPSLATALRSAAARRLAREAESADREAFGAAIRLHEALDIGPLGAPFPVAVALQRALGERLGALTVAADPAGAVVATLPRDSRVRLAADRGSDRLRAESVLRARGIAADTGEAPHRLMLTATAARDLPAPVAEGGIRATREDTLALLRGLRHRDARGRSLHILEGMPDATWAETLGAVARTHEIEMLAEIDAGLFAQAPGEAPARILVVGAARPEAYPAGTTAEALRAEGEIPDAVGIDEFEGLWAWSGDARAVLAPDAPADDEQLGGELGVAGRGLRENEFQAPYAAASRVAEPTTMVPRNMEGATRRALAGTVRRRGAVDTYVADGLGWDEAEIATRLSPEQVDAIGMAMNAHERGRHFCIGDQTGVGKGRTLAGMVRWARERGMPVIFITERANLFSAFMEDLKDVGLDDVNPFILNSAARVTDSATGEVTHQSGDRDLLAAAMQGGTMPEGYDTLFATYSQFNRKAAESARSVWLLAAARGALVLLDESHNAAGDSNIGDVLGAAVEASAMTVHSSATFAKGARNLKIYSRLFPPSMNVAELPEVLKRGGEPLMEVLSAMLAEDGVYIRREHDLSALEFLSVADREREDRNRRYADALSPILAQMAYLSGDIDRMVFRMRAEEAEVLEGGRRGNRGGNGLGLTDSNFGSRLFNLYRLFTTALKTEHAADEAVRALERGEKPVVVLESTMEAALRELHARLAADQGLAPGATVATAMPDFRLLLRRTLDQLVGLDRARNAEAARVAAAAAAAAGAAEGGAEGAGLVNAAAAAVARVPGDDEADDMFVAAQAEEAAEAAENDDPALPLEGGANGDGADAEGGEVAAAMEAEEEPAPELERLLDDPAVRAAYEAISAEIDRFPELPLLSIDVLHQRIAAAGYSSAEITGRSLRWENGHLGSFRPMDRAEAIAAFNSGDLDCLVLTRPGSTGISLHASERFADQRRRTMIELQTANTVTDRLQFYGRVNRRGQVVAPRILTLSSGLPGELRLEQMHNAKLRQLSANTTSNRDHSAISADAMDILNKVGDEVCRRYLEAHPDVMRRLGLSMPDADDAAAAEARSANAWYANKLTARIGLLTTAEQEQAYAEILAEYRAVIDELEAKGRNPLRTREVQGRFRVVNRQVFEGAAEGAATSIFDAPVFLTEMEGERLVRPIRSDRVMDLVNRGWLELGNQTPADASQRLADALPQMLQAVLPVQFDTVEQALAHHVPNAARNLNARIQSLRNLLGNVLPGCEIGFEDEAGHWLAGVITRIHTPERAVEHVPGRWGFEVAIVGEERPIRMTAHAMAGDVGLRILPGLNGPEGEGLLRRFDGFPEGAIRMRRQILDGNLFRAAEISMRRDIGSVAIIRDEWGARHRGIVLNARGVDLDAVPARLTSIEMVVDFVRDVRQGLYGGPEIGEDKHLSVTWGEEGLIVRMPTRRPETEAFIEHPRMQRLLGRFGRPRSRAMIVPPQHAARVLREVWSAGMPFYAQGGHRGWVNDWLQARAEANAAPAEPEAEGDAVNVRVHRAA